MKFENYNQCIHFKENILKCIINKYNEVYKKHNNEKYILNDSYMILNNNNKYYCLIINKDYFYKNIKNTNNNILYFFNNKNDEFYIETDYHIEKTILLEGYIYEDEDESQKNYYITDLLYKDNVVINEYYKKRYERIEEILKELNNIKEYINFKINPIISCNNIEYINLYLNNFKYKKQITHNEYIYGNFNKINKKIKDELNLCENKNENSLHCYKKIIKNKEFVEIYSVYNNITNNYEDLLLVKSIKEARYLEQLFKEKDEINHLCVYNKNFKKYSIVIKN